MGDTLIAAVISSLVGILLGTFAAGAVVWRPIQDKLAETAIDIAVIKKQLVDVVEWQERQETRERHRLDEYDRNNRKG